MYSSDATIPNNQWMKLGTVHTAQLYVHACIVSYWGAQFRGYARHRYNSHTKALKVGPGITSFYPGAAPCLPARYGDRHRASQVKPPFCTLHNFQPWANSHCLTFCFAFGRPATFAFIASLSWAIVSTVDLQIPRPQASTYDIYDTLPPFGSTLIELADFSQLGGTCALTMRGSTQHKGIPGYRC